MDDDAADDNDGGYGHGVGDGDGLGLGPGDDNDDESSPLSLSVTWCQYLSERDQILLQVENISLSPDIVALFFFLYTSLHTAPIFKTFFIYGEKFFSSL